MKNIIESRCDLIFVGLWSNASPWSNLPHPGHQLWSYAQGEGGYRQLGLTETLFTFCMYQGVRTKIGQQLEAVAGFSPEGYSESLQFKAVLTKNH